MKVWISKYALTRGLFEIEVKDSDIDKNLIVDRSTGFSQFYHGEGKEWHKNKEGAIEQAKWMQKNKIKSLHKQIDKINKLTFS